jgi:hypothetical protein
MANLDLLAAFRDRVLLEISQTMQGTLRVGDAVGHAAVASLRIEYGKEPLGGTVTIGFSEWRLAGTSIASGTPSGERAVPPLEPAVCQERLPGRGGPFRSLLSPVFP